MKRSPGRYQELDLFIKVLRLLCPNLTDAWFPMIESFASLCAGITIGRKRIIGGVV